MSHYRTSRIRWLAFFLGALPPVASVGEVYRLPPPGDELIGEIRYAQANNEDTLIDIARENSLGQDEIVMANPDVDRWMPKGGTRVLIPRQFILPDAPRVGVVLNIPEMRLYYYPGEYETVVPKPAPKPKAAKPDPRSRDGKNAKDAKTAKKGVDAKGKPLPAKAAVPAPKPAQPTLVIKRAPTEVITYPVSIGRMDWRTPLGAARVVEKVKDPVWRPPESIKKEHAKDGDFLPDVVPAGPMNPLGQFAMKLSVPGYLIHGTGIDKAYGIGMRVTHGCIRMYPEDIAKLYPQVNVGTPVRLVNQPVKLGWLGEDLYMEVHQPLDEDRVGYDELLRLALDLIEKKTAAHQVVLNGAAVRQALEKPSGVPVLISKPLGFEQPTASEPSAMPEPAPAAEAPETPPEAPQPTAVSDLPVPHEAPPAPEPVPVPDSAAIPDYNPEPDNDPYAAPDPDEDWDQDPEQGI